MYELVFGNIWRKTIHNQIWWNIFGHDIKKRENIANFLIFNIVKILLIGIYWESLKFFCFCMVGICDHAYNQNARELKAGE